MILKPRLTYKGLTIIMSNPSRFDGAELLSATGGWFFRNECLRPHLNVMQCEVRTKEEKYPFLPNTKAILLLGLEAFNEWTGNKADNTLGEIRGSIFYVNNIPAIPSYLPQDCMDNKDYESTHNALLQDKDYDEPSQTADTEGDKRRHGVTSRSNWRFWLRKDTEKAIQILLNEGNIPQSPGYFIPTYSLYPDAGRIIHELTETKNSILYLDIETDEALNIKCLGYSLDNDTISIVPFITHDYKPAYPELAHILRAFSIACCNNTVVAHNGSCFDWPLLIWKYKMLMGERFYDTMLATQRCYPDIEKSLGHSTSLWTYEPFHKDEGSTSYHTFEQARQLWQYCGKDVYTMMLIKRAIDAHAKTVSGLEASIAQVNASIPAYLTMALTGIHYKQEKLDKIMRNNDELMMFYNRVINLLVGDKVVAALTKKSKSSIASSSAKCVAYFHDMLDYPKVMTSKKTGRPSLAKKAIFKLRLKKNNPVLDYVIKYRFTQHESGMLKFNPWTHAQNTIHTNT